MKAKDTRTLEQFYSDCNFESQTQSFTDYMQCQMHRQNKIILPHATCTEENFFFYSKGKEMIALNSDFRDNLED